MFESLTSLNMHVGFMNSLISHYGVVDYHEREALLASLLTDNFPPSNLTWRHSNGEKRLCHRLLRQCVSLVIRLSLKIYFIDNFVPMNQIWLKYRVAPFHVPTMRTRQPLHMLRQHTHVLVMIFTTKYSLGYFARTVATHSKMTSCLDGSRRW